MSSENTLVRLRTLRQHVQRSIEVIRADQVFFLEGGRQRPEWYDLKKVVDVLDCRNHEQYPKHTYMRSVADALEATLEAFTGREALPDLLSISRYLATILEKTDGKYRYEYKINAVFFLSRFRNKLTNRITTERNALRKGKA